MIRVLVINITRAADIPCGVVWVKVGRPRRVRLRVVQESIVVVIVKGLVAAWFDVVKRGTETSCARVRGLKACSLSAIFVADVLFSVSAAYYCPSEASANGFD